MDRRAICLSELRRGKGAREDPCNIARVAALRGRLLLIVRVQYSAAG